MNNNTTYWFGNVPPEWSIERLQWHLDEIKESNNPIQTKQVLSLTNKLGVIPYEEKGEQGNKAKENVEEYKLAYPDTIVANSMNILIGSVGKCNYFGCVSPVYYVFKPKTGENIDFYNYIFQTQLFQKELRKYANGILEIRLRVSSSNILKREIAIPPIEIQNKIVSFLDDKCSKIDELIALENQQIEKLKEYKQALITEIVTKGLDKTVETKDSDVDWIGNINEGYIVKRLKFCLTDSMIYGANESGEKPKDTTNYYRYIRITDITSDNKLKDDEDNVYLLKEKGKSYLLTKYDILFARSGGTVGKTFMYTGDDNISSFAGYLIKASCNKKIILPEFLMYFTQSSVYEAWKNMIFIQATIQNIGAYKYSNMEVVLPSIEDQKSIVKKLDNKCSIIDTLISKKQQKIEKLNEYKKSLIYEYVTGKKEVQL